MKFVLCDFIRAIVGVVMFVSKKEIRIKQCTYFSIAIYQGYDSAL
jgi:hypothetical protein